jgi:putative component of membrane protein insertase Oxa1/YidC/SpoIIIJ protein YidD
MYRTQYTVQTEIFCVSWQQIKRIENCHPVFLGENQSQRKKQLGEGGGYNAVKQTEEENQAQGNEAV